MTVPTVLEGALGTEFPTQTPTEGGAFEKWLNLVGGEASANLPPVEEEPTPEHEPKGLLSALGLPFLPQEVAPIPKPIPQEAQTQPTVLRGLESSKQWSIEGCTLPSCAQPEGGMEIATRPSHVERVDPHQTAFSLENKEMLPPATPPSELPNPPTDSPLKPLADREISVPIRGNGSSEQTPLFLRSEGVQEQSRMPLPPKEAATGKVGETAPPSVPNTSSIESLVERILPRGDERLLTIEGDAPTVRHLPLHTPSERAEPLTAPPPAIHPPFALGAQSGVPTTSTAPEGSNLQAVANSAVVEQVAQFLERMTLDPDQNRVHLQLNPPELGSLEIQIRVEGSEVQAWVQAEHDLTRRALEQSLQQLRDQLASRGLQLSGFSISTGNPRSGAYPFKQSRVTFGSDAWNLARHATESVHLQGQWSVWA